VSALGAGQDYVPMLYQTVPIVSNCSMKDWAKVPKDPVL